MAETLDLPDPDDNYGMFRFTDMSHPSYDRVCRMIRSNEDIIDRTVRQSWRENRVTNQVLTIEFYWHDVNAWRQDYYNEGGNYVQLRKDVLPWDPSKGDKLEIKTRSNFWMDISSARNTTEMTVDQKDANVSAGIGQGFWFDYHLGKLYLRTSMFQNLAHSLRISYRYGQEVPYVMEEDPDDPEKTRPARDEHGYLMVDRDQLDIPEGINRMCCLMTAIQILNMQMFNVKVGVSGDIGSARGQTIKAWEDEIAMLKSSFQRSGAVRSLYR